MDVMGVDCYNLCGTGSIGRTLATSSSGLNEHIPVVCHEVQMDDGVILVFKERAGCAGGGKGILITENKSFILSTLLDEAICFEKPSNPIILNDQGGQ